MSALQFAKPATRHVPLQIIIACLLGFALQACAISSNSDESSKETPTRSIDGAGSPTEADVPTPVPTHTLKAATPGSTGELPDPVRAAIAQAADTRDISESDITLLGFERVEWTNSALGCPKEGQFYADVIVSGYIVRLEVSGQTIEYHTDTGRRVVSCDASP